MNDEELSALIREAKPLYFARQKRRKIFYEFSAMGCVFAVMLMTFLNNRPLKEVYYNDYWADEIYQAQNGSVIEDMGFPVDEFGLLLVG